MNILLASTSTLYGGNYLEYLREELRTLFNGVEELLFVPFARPGGLSHEDYTTKVQLYFEGLNIKVRGLHEYQDKASAIDSAQAYFTGGGNTFLLVKSLHDYRLMRRLSENVKGGKPYLGCSAGSVIGAPNMMTTNDMPIVYPPSFDCLGLVPFNINAHFLDPVPQLRHNGETRETRILEFLTQNDQTVVGLREGSWIRRLGDKITTEGSENTRVFRRGAAPYEVPPGTIIN